ncbi:LysR family substrate-binding domain-containing protein [Azorhizobium sp. AG788]|uniref:LysR family substrate-binding domain-containing protein n=1 Tax=Azorhizobium sp. AG788 TaxID=2183897 RepID=UPI0031392BB8
MFADFARQKPEIDVEFHEASAAHHLLSLGMARLDLAFTIGNSHAHSYDAIEVWHERVFLAFCEGHPLTFKSRLAWSELAQERLLTSSGGSGDEISAYVTDRVRAMGGEPKVVAHKIGRYSLLGLVASCLGIMPLLESETIVSIPGVTYRPIGGEVLPIFVITSPKNDSPAARALLTLARTTGQSG